MSVSKRMERKFDIEDVENSEDDRRRMKVGLINLTDIANSTNKREKQRVGYRFTTSVFIESVRNAEEEHIVFAFREQLAANDLLPEQHDNYSEMLRSTIGVFRFFFLPSWF